MVPELTGFVRLEDGRRTFDRDAFDAAFPNLDPVSRKERLQREIARFDSRPRIPRSLRKAVFDRDGHACVQCGATERLSLDHIRPYSRGGLDVLANLQTLCLSCNSRKADRI